MTINQKRAYSEILEILNNMPLDIKSKIPENIMENINLQKDNDWKYEYDKTIALENQKILYTTKVLFSYLYINYIASKGKKEELESIYMYNSKEKYNSDKLFKKENRHINDETSIEMNNGLIKSKESFWNQIKSFIFKILHINK